MDERRTFFRIKNTGYIHAKYGEHELSVIDISSAGAMVIKKNLDLSEQGLMELVIQNLLLNMHYKVLKNEEEITVIVFTQEAEINTLFTVLKRIRDEQRRLMH